MKIGIVGFGAIAKRVYLPLYLDNKNIDEIFVCGRNIKKLEKRLNYYNFHLYDEFEKMLEQVDCLMVHSATVSHYDYIKTALKKHIPVYVDKPLTDDTIRSKELIEIAKDTNTLLFVGYNRRFAPLYLEVKKMELSPYKIHYEKHRSTLTNDENYETAIIDDFIHLIDTVVDLNHKQIKLKSSRVNTTKEDELLSLYVDLSNADQINTLFMSRESSNDYEKVTIHAKDQVVTVEDMRVLKILKNNKETIVKINERLSDSQIRGFENTLNAFFNQVKENVFSESKQLDSELLCFEVVEYLKATKQ